MVKKKKNVCLGFILKKVDETRNYILEEIKHHNLMKGKH